MIATACSISSRVPGPRPTFPQPAADGSSVRSTQPSRQRNLIERFFCKPKHFRRIATRFDKLARNFLAAVILASTRLWLRAYESTP
jgi:transposase